MEFRGRYDFAATPEQVFDAMTRPETVAACLPGCDKLVPLGEDRYQATMTLGVAAIKGRFRGTVALREQNRPESFMLQVDALLDGDDLASGSFREIVNDVRYYLVLQN